MKTIVAIVGPSGSGKTTAAKCLEHCLGYQQVISCTTRAMRPGEKCGVDHWFMKPEDMPTPDMIIAYTFFGGHHYWVSYSEIPKGEVVTYVIDEDGLRMLMEEHGAEFDIIPVLIKRDREKLVKQVGEERVKRDELRRSLPESTYKYIINNNTNNMRTFLEDVRKVGIKIKDYYVSTYNK